MNKLLFFTVLFSIGAYGQDPETIVRSVADHVIGTTAFSFTNPKSGEVISGTQGLKGTEALKINTYHQWEYVNGVMNIGMVELGHTLNDPKYTAYAKHNFDFIFSNLDYFKKQYDAGIKTDWTYFYRMGKLDDCGALAAALADVYAVDAKKQYLDYLNKVSAFMLQQQSRLPDGTFARKEPRSMTVWADDLYMSVPYLVRMAKLTGDNKYFDDAIRQVENFNKYLFDPAANLYWHCYYNDNNINGVAHWGRCNGWVAVAQTELLNNLPPDHPKRAELIRLLLRQITGFSRYQDPSGLWHQILDKQDAYLESSVTAMFVYTVARAVNQKWINQSYLKIAEQGWKGLTSKINAAGEIADVCVGTNIEEDIFFYYNRPKVLNDAHATGAVLLAGAEMIKATRKTQ